MLLRTATLADVPRLAELNRDAYPDLIQDDVVFHEAQLAAHQKVFPDGQIVAQVDGALAGAMATLILPDAIDALGPHTWIGVTDGGYFTRHDPRGKVLYLADIYVHPQHQGRGVARALYQELFALCVRRACERVVAGGRLWGFHDAGITPERYVADVIEGKRKDRVLQSQLRAGFHVRGILKGYLHDWRSGHHASLLEWVSPAARKDPICRSRERAGADAPSPSAEKDGAASR
jgi:GNAT superfamily N-acetyltransferase